MTLISMKYLLLLVAIAAAALFIATATPAQARGGGSFASPSAKFMQKNGMQMHANTRPRATKQTATGPKRLQRRLDRHPAGLRSPAQR